jgi:hypothetical protein
LWRREEHLAAMRQGLVPSMSMSECPLSLLDGAVALFVVLRLSILWCYSAVCCAAFAAHSVDAGYWLSWKVGGGTVAAMRQGLVPSMSMSECLWIKYMFYLYMSLLVVLFCCYRMPASLPYTDCCAFIVC